MNRLIIYIVVLMSVLFVACDANVVFDDSQKIDDNVWNMQNKRTFSVNIKTIDRTSLYRFAINISNTKDYKYNNIYFFLTTIYPDESKIRKYPDGRITKINPNGTITED